MLGSQCSCHYSNTTVLYYGCKQHFEEALATAITVAAIGDRAEGSFAIPEAQ